MNELKELDEIENLCERIYNSGSDDNSYRFNECVESIMQLIEAHTAKKELEARIDELEHVDGYECYWTQIKDTPDIKTDIDIDERITQLSSQLKDIK